MSPETRRLIAEIDEEIEALVARIEQMIQEKERIKEEDPCS